MAYEIYLERNAQKFLSKTSKDSRDKIIFTIQQLTDNPRPAGCKKLTGREAWRIRVSDYRIIYEIRDKELVILVVDIGHRREIYKR